MNRKTFYASFASLTAVLASGTALAHPGGAHVHGFIDGLTHPLTGMDHLLAALSVGLFAGLLSGKARLGLPVLFAAVLAIGIGLGVTLGIPAWELGLAASVVALGGAVAFAPRLTNQVGALVATVAVVVTGLVHGHAHGAELPSDSGAIAYALGLVAGSSTVVGLGLGVARTLGASPTRLAGKKSNAW